MEIIKLKISEIERASYNPRMNLKTEMEEEYLKLKKSISTFGYVNLLTVNFRDFKYILVGGHQRLDVLEELYGSDYIIDVVCIEVDEEQEKALNIALNKISGDWNIENLKELLADIEDTSLTGFNDIEVEALLKDVEDVLDDLPLNDEDNKPIKLTVLFTSSYECENLKKELRDRGYEIK